MKTFSSLVSLACILCVTAELAAYKDFPTTQEETISRKVLQINQVRLGPLKKIHKFHVMSVFNYGGDHLEKSLFNRMVASLGRIGDVVVVDETTPSKDVYAQISGSTVLALSVDQIPERRCNSSVEWKLLPVIKVEMVINSSVRVLESQEKGVCSLWADARYFVKADNDKISEDKCREYLDCLIDQFNRDYKFVNPDFTPTFIVFKEREVSASS